MTSLAPTTWTQAFQKTVKPWLPSGVSNFVSRFTGGDSAAASSRSASKKHPSLSQSQRSQLDKYAWIGTTVACLPIDADGVTNVKGAWEKLRTHLNGVKDHLTPETQKVANRFVDQHPMNFLIRFGDIQESYRSLYKDTLELQTAIDEEVESVQNRPYASYLNPLTWGADRALENVQRELHHFTEVMSMTGQPALAQLAYDYIGRTARNIKQDRLNARTWGETIRDTVKSFLPFGQKGDELQDAATKARQALTQDNWLSATPLVEEYHHIASQASQANTKASRNSCSAPTTSRRQSSKGTKHAEPPVVSENPSDSSKGTGNSASAYKPSDCDALTNPQEWDLDRLNEFVTILKDETKLRGGV
ncbi:hypothetical protein DB88DRAFT_542632 [Papiliotrema laurentii]|uniref:Uncharacterized protein n=1 Tax=Papiliotrema laurentii TaxID=5418 RepID=A0AAD9CUM4_PAPLA|nr:hypothetical protein DB88DRAFT_542632 [Papiliotrema laurentii]